ncbi:MAG: ABC transporter ATP-binding protein [Armatimonadota bacterium]|nr:ABC transporter ATP-binding protein [Armatimonadota bacterium]MDR7452032.1 ABC transporter ATP-binding protein [Armatimonadota bacterium]MDR7467923.1 ABC transporter ATP-binding protein [Armatimonadota bacterium]MDR7494224.1 ABC transporter ATP-binding protein [Armatimonadota bacterium]MDR7547828.1 ABC transporter ATP-binding protein [Armatimonadota bacterium]
MPNPLVVLRRVTKIYPRGIVALQEVDLEIGRGEFVAIVGPSGSGKSTLLHLVGGLDRPSSGEIRVGGMVLNGQRDLTLFRRRMVGFVFQSHHLIPVLTALENVELPMVALRLPPGIRRERAAHLLARVGLSHRMAHLPGDLSGGECQRVAVARALANDPALLLADEPTGELDSETGRAVVALLEELNREGRTVLLVTHNPQVAAAARREIELRDGRIARDVKKEAARFGPGLRV